MAHEKRGTEYGVLHFDSKQSGTLLEVICAQTQISPDEIKTLSELGCVYLNDARIGNLNDIVLAPGQYIRLHTKPRRFYIEPKQIDIVFQNEDFVVANKPSGIPVHATVDNVRDNLIEFLRVQLGLKLFITHRLDIATSGLILLAKTTEFQAHFNALLKFGKVVKEYRAVVSPNPGASRIEPGRKLIHYMEPSPRSPKTVGLEPKDGWQRCILNILDVHPVDNGALEILIGLETGRTHQIRAQLAYEKWPIVGDISYGSLIEPAHRNQIALTSHRLNFGNFNFSLD